MRQIKFRHYDKRLNNFLIFELLPVGIARDETIVSFDKDRLDSPIEQFTGLTDKNGVEIYEGDTVDKGDSAFVKWGIVSFIHGCWMVANNNGERYFNLHWHLSQVEVVGNIHQNPELLEGDK